MPTSVVTGGAGFLGSHLCDYLLEQGHRVICVDNLETGSLENIEHDREPGAFTFMYHDVVEPIWIDEPIDVVFHLAALASPVDYMRLPLHSLKVGSYGTHHALGLAKWKRARFVISSTSEVYGDPQVHPQPETYWGNVNPIGPRGVYDEARGLYLLATTDEPLPVNIGNPDHEVTMLELAQACIRVTGSPSEIVFEALPVDDPQQRRPDITRARQILGWAPEVDLEDGLRRWLKALGREPVPA